jgi:hypothetical protein
VPAVVVLSGSTACGPGGVSPADYATAVCRALSLGDRTLLTGARQAVSGATTTAGRGDVPAAAERVRAAADAGELAFRGTLVAAVRSASAAVVAAGQTLGTQPGGGAARNRAAAYSGSC